jgi:hypothetical protein
VLTRPFSKSAGLQNTEIFSTAAHPFFLLIIMNKKISVFCLWLTQKTPTAFTPLLFVGGGCGFETR